MVHGISPLLFTLHSHPKLSMSESSEPVNMLYDLGKGGFVHVIKSRSLLWKGYLGFSDNHKSPYKREAGQGQDDGVGKNGLPICTIKTKI